MWKALINLVNKWAYRCEHNYALVRKNSVLDRGMYEKGVEIPCRTEHLYFCNKCGESKKIS